MPDFTTESTTTWKRLGRLFRLSAAEQRPERRSETRIPDHGPVALRRSQDSGDAELVLARLVDCSSAGVRVRCRTMLEPGAQVELENQRSSRLSAVVRWVQKEGEDVEVGLATAFSDSTSSNGDPSAI